MSNIIIRKIQKLRVTYLNWTEWSKLFLKVRGISLPNENFKKENLK